jgi:DnaJ family protein A protein 2
LWFNITKEKKILEINVGQGMKHGQRITYEDEADENPGMLPGDIIFILNQQEHSLFTRRDTDLII